MSLLSWFMPKKKADAPHSGIPSSGLSRLDSTRPFHAPRQAGTAQPANRKQERMARRELLYTVVRESMVRAGVLTASYKFKVLSLDARGRQFLVMVDLAQGSGIETTRLAEIEALIAQAAKTRYDIIVTAVYWRANEYVAVGDPAPRSQPQSVRGSLSRPAPLLPEPPAGRAVAPVAAVAAVAAVAPVVVRPSVDPLHPSEVVAFQRVLDASVRGEQALASAGHAQSYTLLTGFEDTEMAGGEAAEPDLSGTQYGELR